MLHGAGYAGMCLFGRHGVTALGDTLMHARFIQCGRIQMDLNQDDFITQRLSPSDKVYLGFMLFGGESAPHSLRIMLDFTDSTTFKGDRMSPDPKTITLSQLPEIIASHFQHKSEITCYVGSNAATPTSSLEAVTAALKARSPKLPFMKMVHLLLQGPVPYVEEGLQDRVMAYSIFSGGDVRKAANEGRAFYLPCTLANLDSLIGKGRRFEPDVAIF